MAKAKKPKRNYRKEYENEQKKLTWITVKIKKEQAEKFKQKLKEDSITIQQFFREHIENYVNSQNKIKKVYSDEELELLQLIE